MTTVLIAKMFWQQQYLAVLRLEPFYQLAQPDGASLKDTLSSTYLTAFSWVVPFRAMRRRPRRHIAVVLSSLIYIMASDLLPVALAAMNHVDWYLLDEQGMPLVTRRYAAILMLCILLLIIVCALWLLILLSRRRTGLFGDPISIGGIASLIAYSDLLNRFRQLRSYDTQARIDEALGSCKIHLRYDRQARNPYQICLLDSGQVLTAPTETAFMQKRSEAHNRWLWGRSLVLQTIVVITPYVVIWYCGRQVMSVQEFLIIGKVGLAVVAIVNASLVTNWQCSIALLEPYYRLQTRKAVDRIANDTLTGNKSKSQVQGSAKALDLDFISTPLITMFSALRRSTRSKTVSFISFCTILMELLIILNPAFVDIIYAAAWRAAFHQSPPQAISISLATSSWFAVIAGPFVLIEIGIVVCRKRKPFLPRKPDTLSSVILYLCHSHWLLDHVSGTSIQSKEQRDAHSRGHLFGFGWVQPEGDEHSHIAIEEVQNISRAYRYGEKLPENAR